MIADKFFLVTGGAGFIGSNLTHYLLERRAGVVVLDSLTYAGHKASLAKAFEDPRFTFVEGDIADAELLRSLFERYRFAGVLNLAAESHVDRSIDAPSAFIRTNIEGTFRLLEAARSWLDGLDGRSDEKAAFRFLHVSTDEVFGSLGDTGRFSESDPYAPNSPYAASKASADHLVRAWHRSYGLPTLTTNCSNNYGPYQFPEKLIPHMILSILRGGELPIYGDGRNVRDWLYVADHCSALAAVLERGRPGESYNVGGNCERSNLEVVNLLCDVLDERHPGKDGRSHRERIRFVPDRPGHDRRYAIDSSKIRRELNWRPEYAFESGIRATVSWYLENEAWLQSVTKDYQLKRLGMRGPS